MEDKIMKMKKEIKGDRIFLSLIVTLLIGFAFNHIYDIVQLAKKAPEVFEVKMIEDERQNGTYHLFVEGEQWSEVNYNEYMASVDAQGNTNFKMCLIIEKVGKITSNLFMAVIFYFAYLMLDNIFQPFSKNNIRRLRIIAVLTMLLSLMPVVVMTIMRYVYFSYVNVAVSQINPFIILSGILFGVLSEIFKYGFELQDEIDQIC
ncbi:DUF2975 domain-containing protein [Candidatus Galacturonibacter soehngenii]|nr:DUF2975 domain-containing protein [Candidatus Galacturonibacter soehngenii]MBA4688539.1 DUF2975 domain-containing protein [Candidatus Galacturonibacter soehngenii]